MKIVEAFYEHLCQKQRFSQNTVMSYLRDIKKYIEFLNNTGIKIEDTSQATIITYIINMQKAEGQTAQ